MEAIGNFFSYIFNVVWNFIMMIWNGFIGLLTRVFPQEFAYMLAIIILAIIFIIIFRAVLSRRPKN